MPPEVHSALRQPIGPASGPAAAGRTAASDRRIDHPARASILVSHPGLQHSHQLALALHERQLLKAFWSGVPVVAEGETLPWWLPQGYRQRVRRVDIPAAMRRHPMRFQLLTKAAARFGSDTLRGDNMHRVFHAYDAWAAAQVRTLRPKTVIAYENAAYHTFAAAREVGARCVLDAAACHHATVSDALGPEGTPYTPEINRRKDAEIAMADLILTCSPLAADTYADNGVERARLRPLLLGANPVALPPADAHRTRDGGPPRFIFAGPLSRRKAVDLLVAAFRRLHAEGVACELHCVGGVVDSDMLDAVRETPNARYFASVAQPELFRMVGEADCLVLPSRSDSFGMVVAEAMSCGIPALVSTQTGAKAIIEAHPASGWIVEPDADALYAKLRHLIENPAELQRARAPALEASKEFSWAQYRKRAGTLLEDFLQ